jgi:putative nucleotidyltransferase with HDIG domain
VTSGWDRFPTESGDGRPPASSPARGGTAPEPSEVGGLRVLLVDANARVLRFMAFAFISNDCLVSTASTAEDALAMLSTAPLDLVVTEVDLPGTTGLDLLVAVKGKFPGIPVVLTTGAASIDAIVFGLRHQAYDYLRKPFSVEEVQQLVERLKQDRQRGNEGGQGSSMAEEMARRQSGIEALSLIGDLALQGFDSADFVEQALDRAIRGVSGEAALLLLHDEDGNTTVSQRGDRAVTGELLGLLTPALRDLSTNGEHGSVPVNSPSQAMTALAAVVPGPGKPLGILCVARGRDREYSAEERDLLFGYARVIAVALQKMVLNERLEANLIDTISSFVVAMEAKDGYLKGHSARVSLYVGEIAKAMNLPPAQAALARRAGVLHDLGKLVLKDSIYQKPGALTYEGSALMRAHPMSGAEILKPLRFLAHEAEAIHRHHERYDGTGYPGGLKGEQIPLAARLIAVADAFDAMTSRRPYRPALPVDAALEEIRRHAGTQFDPAVTAAFERIPLARLTEIARFYDTRPEPPLGASTRTPSALHAASKRLLEGQGWSMGHAIEDGKRRQGKPGNVIGIARAALRRQVKDR